MNVQQKSNSGIVACSRCGGHGVVEVDAKLFECECSELRSIGAAMPESILRSRVTQEHITIYNNSGLSHYFKSPAIRQPFYLIQGARQDVQAIIKLAHMMLRYVSASQILYRTDKDLCDDKTLPYDLEKGNDESLFTMATNLLANTKILVLTLGVSQSKQANSHVQEAISMRLQSGMACWVLAFDDVRIEKAACYSEGLKTSLGRFESLRIGAAPAPAPTAPKISASVSKYDGSCTVCSKSISKGDAIAWANKRPVHPGCA